MNEDTYSDDLDPLWEAVIEEDDLEEDRLLTEANPDDGILPEAMSEDDQDFERMLDEIESEPESPSPNLSWEDQK